MASWLSPLAIVVAGLWAYANSLRGAFHFDDVACIVDNPAIRQLWPGWRALLVPPANGLVGRPVVSLSLGLNYALGGLSVSGYHVVNVLIHLLAALCLFGIVRRTLRLVWPAAHEAGRAAALAGAVALLWVVHPLHTESVTYIIQRAEALMGLWALLTLYCAIRAATSRHPAWWAMGAVAGCALGMATKPVMATVPLVVWLYDRAFLAGSCRAAWRARGALYLGLASTWGLLVLLILIWSGHTQPTAGFGLPTLTWWQYARTQPWVILHYLRLALWPHPLVVDYSWPIAETWDVLLLPGVGLAALLTLTVLAWRRNPRLGFPGVAFFLLLAPTSSLIPVADLAVEHRMYLPLAPVLMGLVLLADRGLRRLVVPETARCNVAIATLALVVGALGVTTIRRNRGYETEERLWRVTVAQRPTNPRARNNLAQTLTQFGQPEEAIAHLRIALQLYPDYADAHYNLATALARAGRMPEALAEYRIAVRLNPRTSPQMHNNLGVALAQQGTLDEAVRHLEEALQLNPESSAAHYNLANLLVQRGKLDDAIAHYAAALRLTPDAPEVHTNLANTLFLQGRVDEAIAHYTAALRLDPRHVNARARLGAALANQGRLDEAIVQYQEALRLRPDVAEMHNDLAAALAQEGRLEAAALHVREALRLNPAYAEAHNNLGNLLLLEGKREEAIAQYEEALRLSPADPQARRNLERAQREGGRPTPAPDVVE